MMAKKRGNVVSLSDYGTKEGRAKAGDALVFEERSAKEGKALRGRVMAPCEYLAKRGFITRDQATAGERLATSFYNAGLIKATTVNLLGIRGGARDHTPVQLDAMRDFNAAMRALGPGLDDCAYFVCILECSVGEYESAAGIGTNRGAALVKVMFRQLAEHYGLEKNET